jgi:uroporphyrinogen decarboxylase
MTPTGGKFVNVLNGTRDAVPPVWMMRQAGRYLPEYRATRVKAGSFLDLCYNPELAAQVTLQPIERFEFDAAILFADILLIPDALGQKVWFEEGAGPQLEALTPGGDLSVLVKTNASAHLAPVMETIRRVRAGLADDKALIGFCGAPWTVATYMVAGRGTPDQKPARLAAYQNRSWFGELIDIVVESSAEYLIEQIDAGCQAVQIFDSWSGVLPQAEFNEWCVTPVCRIVELVKAVRPDCPIIGFPRGCGALYADYAEQTGVDAVSLDSSVSMNWACRAIPKTVVLQGNLDPLSVVAGGDAMINAVDAILSETAKRPFIFNLGHGLVPETPPDHVAQVVARIRQGG